MTQAQGSQRTWVVVAIVGAVVGGALALALVIYLVTGSGDVGSDSPSASAASSRWLAATGADGEDLVRIDLGAGGRAVPLDSSTTYTQPDVYTFASADGVKVRVEARTLYNDGWDDQEQLADLVRDYKSDYLVECSSKNASGTGDPPLPTGTAATGAYLRTSVTCEPGVGQEPGRHEIYAFASAPHRSTPENVAHDWVLVDASSESGAVEQVLERAVATVSLGSESSAPGPGAAPVPPDPGPERADRPVSIWGDTRGFYFPAAWSVVGAGSLMVVAPEESGIDAVLEYASPGVVLARNGPKPGGEQSTSTLSDEIVDDYAEIATDNGCTERSDFEPTDGAIAEIRWTGCPNGMVDRVVVHPDGSGVVLVSVRASDDDIAADLAYELSS